MSKYLIGRKKEQIILEAALHSEEAEMVSVIGRRRVGKTFLVKSVYKNRIDFILTGIQDATKKEQLLNFANQLGVADDSIFIAAPPNSWLDAFFQLIRFLKQKKKGKQEKQVVFLDELPWLATPRSAAIQRLKRKKSDWQI